MMSTDGLTFLLVDDDVALLQLVEAMLKVNSTCKVLKALSALTALNILADTRERVDCIICDYSMGPMNGLEFLKEIRMGRHLHVPRDIRFVMLTGSGDSGVVQTAVELDVSGYVVKPVTKATLLKAIARAFSRRLEPKPEAFYGTMPMPGDL